MTLNWGDVRHGDSIEVRRVIDLGGGATQIRHERGPVTYLLHPGVLEAPFRNGVFKLGLSGYHSISEWELINHHANSQ